jgi:hypothetical protein
VVLGAGAIASLGASGVAWSRAGAEATNANVSAEQVAAIDLLGVRVLSEGVFLDEMNAQLLVAMSARPQAALD